MDEPIRLLPFAVDPEEYRRTFFRYGLAQRLIRIVIALAIICAGLGFLFGTSGAVGGVAGSVALLGLILIVRSDNLAKTVRHKDNASVFTSRHVEIVNGEYHMATSEGIRSTVPLRCFRKMVDYGPFLLLFLTQGNFYAVPKSAFAAPADRERFEAALRANGVIR